MVYLPFRWSGAGGCGVCVLKETSSEKGEAPCAFKAWTRKWYRDPGRRRSFGLSPTVYCYKIHF